MKLIINESQSQTLMNHFENPKPVFDLVLTENEKYLILMDEVFVNGGNGKSIGSIWENTHIFNEILTESLQSKNLLTEDIGTVINEISWDKDDITNWINEQEKKEEEESWFQRNIGKSWNNLKDGKDAISSAFKGDVLPFLRWVRRMSMTNIGIVIDIIGSILTVKGSVVVWLIIAGLDIFEIATSNYDPKDPDRQNLPYFYLIMDLISAVFTAASGGLFKASIKNIAEKGVTNPRMFKWLTSISNKIPWLSKQIKNVLNMLSKKFNKGGFIQKMISFVDDVLGKLVDFIKRLLSKSTMSNAVKSGTKSGGAVIGINKALEYGINSSSLGTKIGNAAQSVNNGISDTMKKVTGKSDLGVNNTKTDLIKKYIKYGTI